MHDTQPQPDCLSATLCIIGDQWTARILRELTVESCTFSQLEISLESISPRTLSQRLERLLQEEVIEKVLYCPHPPRYRYSLTQKGLELQDVLKKMYEWGEKYPCKVKG